MGNVGESGSGSSFTGKLRGEDVTLNNVNVQDITVALLSAWHTTNLVACHRINRYTVTKE